MLSKKILRWSSIRQLPAIRFQGVDPHFDPGFLSFVRSIFYLLHSTCDRELTLKITQLLQASPHHKALQVQNLSGEWIDVPPIPGTLVINISKGQHVRSLVVRFHSRLHGHLVNFNHRRFGVPRWSLTGSRAQPPTVFCHLLSDRLPDTRFHSPRASVNVRG